MAEEKKPKIDLKARLGKKTVTGPAPGAGGGAVPPPVGIPKPTGVPIPPFGQEEKPKKKKPKVDHSDPYAAISSDDAGARAAEPQAIKVEMSEEVVKAQKKLRMFIGLAAVLAAIVGGLLGFVFGGRSQSAKVTEQTIKGAGELVSDIETANEQAETLNEIVGRIQKSLGKNEYPEKEIKELGGTRIEFDGTKLVGRGFGRFKASMAVQLLTYTSKAQEANDQKEKIQRLLAALRKPLEEYFEQKDPKKAKVKWGVIVFEDKHGPIVEMKQVPDPFLMKHEGKVKVKVKKKGSEEEEEVEKDYEYPEEFKFKIGGRDVKLKRWDGKKSPTRKVIPVDPSSHNAVCPSDIQTVLAKELSNMAEIMKGRKGRADDEKPGLVDTGETLLTQLKEIAAHAN